MHALVSLNQIIFQVQVSFSLLPTAHCKTQNITKSKTLLRKFNLKYLKISYKSNLWLALLLKNQPSSVITKLANPQQVVEIKRVKFSNILL